MANFRLLSARLLLIMFVLLLLIIASGLILSEPNPVFLFLVNLWRFSKEPILWLPIFGLTILCYFAGRRAVKREKPYLHFWFVPKLLTKYAHNWKILLTAALFLSGLFLICSYGLMYFFQIRSNGPLPPPISVRENQGIAFILIGSTIGMAGLLNTIALLYRQLTLVTEQHELWFQLREIKKKIEDRNPRQARNGGQAPAPRITENIAAIDATPYIGQLIDPQLAKRFYTLFSDFAKMDYCKTNYVFLASRQFTPGHHGEQVDGPLEAFYRTTLEQRYSSSMTPYDEASLTDEIKELVKEAEKGIEQLDCKNTAVWRSSQIQSEHYFVASDACVTYFVTPETLGDGYVLKGLASMETGYAGYVRDVVDYHLRKAVTPSITSDNASIVFDVGQANVEKIELYFARELSHLDERSIEKNRSKGIIMVDQIAIEHNFLTAGHPYAIQGGTIPTIADYRWIKIRINKKHGSLISPFSNAVLAHN